MQNVYQIKLEIAKLELKVAQIQLELYEFLALEFSDWVVKDLVTGKLNDIHPSHDNTDYQLTPQESRTVKKLSNRLAKTQNKIRDLRYGA